MGLNWRESTAGFLARLGLARGSANTWRYCASRSGRAGLLRRVSAKRWSTYGSSLHRRDWPMRRWRSLRWILGNTNGQRQRWGIWRLTSCPIIAVRRAISKHRSSMQDMVRSTKSTGLRGQLKGSIAVMHLALEPFTTPSPPNVRLAALCDAGAVAVVAIDPKDGRRVEYHNGGDWREPETAELPIPAVTTSREHGALLQKRAGEGQAAQAIR